MVQWTWNRSGLAAYMSRLFPNGTVEDFPILAAVGCAVGGTANALTVQPRRCEVHGLSMRDATVALGNHIDALLTRQPGTHSELVVRVSPFVATVDADGKDTIGPWQNMGTYDVMCERPHTAWGGGQGALVLQGYDDSAADDDADPDVDDDDEGDEGDEDPDDAEGMENGDDADDDDGDPGEEEEEEEEEEPDDGEPEEEEEPEEAPEPPRNRHRDVRKPKRRHGRAQENRMLPAGPGRRNRPHPGYGGYFMQTPRGFVPVPPPPPAPMPQSSPQNDDMLHRAADAYFRLAEVAISTALGASDRQHQGQQDQVAQLTSALTEANKQSAGQMERVVLAERTAAATVAERTRDEIRRAQADADRAKAEAAAARQQLQDQEKQATQVITQLTEEMTKLRDTTARAKAEAKASTAEGESMEERLLGQVAELAMPRIIEKLLPNSAAAAAATPAPAAAPAQVAAAAPPRRIAPAAAPASAAVEYLEDGEAPPQRAPRRLPPAAREPDKTPAAAPAPAPAPASSPIEAAVAGLRQVSALPKPVRSAILRQLRSHLGEGELSTLLEELNELGESK